MTFLPSMHVVFPTEHVFTNYRHSWHNWFSQPMTWRTNDLLVVRDGRLWRTNTDDRRLFHATKFEAETDPSVIRLNLTDEYERQTPFRATRFQLRCPYTYIVHVSSEKKFTLWAGWPYKRVIRWYWQHRLGDQPKIDLVCQKTLYPI